MSNTIIRHVTAITVDKDRQVLDNAAIAINAERIVAIGPDEEIAATVSQSIEQIDGSGMVAIPGLIDCHSHAGHGLVRSLGAGDGEAWFNACVDIYARGSDENFWRAEARLAQLERLKAGVTTNIALLGGGADIYRTDDSKFGDAHCQTTLESGLRTILAVGPGRSPFPLKYRQYDQHVIRDIDVSFQRQLEVSEELICNWNNSGDQRIGICLIMPVYSAGDLEEAGRKAEIEAMSSQVSRLQAKHGVLFTQDGHRNGSIAIARDLGLLGPQALLSHCVDLTDEDIVALKETGTHVVHNPSAIMSVYGRCPAPELIEQGINVCIGSDASAPDRGFDMFRHMAQCMHYHRRHFRDPSYMPPGKVFEMTTIDPAKALGMDSDLGSLEVGKKADIVLVDMQKPHLYPPNMPVTRITHFANAGDVDTVIVDGKILLRQRRPVVVNEEEILNGAKNELAQALKRSGLEKLMEEPANYWGVARQQRRRYPV